MMQTATEAGYCDYPETNYDCDGNCLNDSDQDGICNEFEVAGCTDSSACNYDSDATDDDASCTYATAGSIAMATVWLIQTKTKSATKMKSRAAKTIALATTMQQRRMQAIAITRETNYDCDGNCLNDSDQDGICDEFEVARLHRQLGLQL